MNNARPSSLGSHMRDSLKGVSRAQRSTSEAKWCAADPGPFRSVAVPDQRCTAISAFTRVHSPSKTGVNALHDALWRCTASGTRGLICHPFAFAGTTVF